MNFNHEIQKEILLKLIHNPELSFSELWDGKKDSNKFSYHLSSLESKGLVIKKENGKYSLSEEGKKLSAFIEGDTGTKAVVPTFAHGLIIKDNDKILVQKRLKEPFYGYWGLISGKINYGFNVEECAKRDLTEETGLKAKSSKLIGINQIKTFQDNELAFHHIIFLVELSDLEGSLKEKTHKAENAWLTIQEFNKKERLPDPWLETVLNSDKLIILETERTMEDSKFNDCKIKTMRTI